MTDTPVDDPHLETALDAAADAARLQRERLGDVAADYKAPRDLVTEVDRECERLIAETIAERHPDHAIEGEEGGKRGDAEERWIVDPVDGTTNYVHGLPTFAVSIAFERGGRVEAGVVHHTPTDGTFAAVRGAGAYLNGEPIAVSGAETIEESLIAADYGTDAPPIWFDALDGLVGRAHSVRLLGSAATALAFVAAGRLDGFYHYDLSEWDYAAGALLVAEAGGVTSARAFRSGDATALVATNGTIQDDLRGVVE